tara:strand:+ start:2577 stop:3383 length:807 start_codon:yes stop_codon:yes gene_type:complete
MNTKESLKGKAIVISGVFEKYSRKELKTLIVEEGGKASSSISKNTSFILAGDKMGPNKKLKAEKLNIEIIGEEEFITRFLNSSDENEEKISISELGLEDITFSDFLGLYTEDEISEIKNELASEGSYYDDWMEFGKDEDSGKITAYLITGNFEIIDQINEMKICENDPYIMIVKDSWSGENKDGEEVGYVSFEALYADEEPPVLKGGEYDKKSFMTKSELDEFNELCENESVNMDDCKYQEFYFLKKSEYNPKEWIEKWLSEDYGHNK